MMIVVFLGNRVADTFFGVGGLLFDLTLRDVGGNVFVKDYERKEHQDDKCDRYVCFVFFHDYIFEKIL